MSLERKRIWIDIEEPKTAIMFRSLIDKISKEKARILITARDYDSTYQILDDYNLEYGKIGKYGGPSLEDKLQAYIERISQLYPIIKSFNPNYFLTFSSVEGARISFGLKIPSIGYNDEPRNAAVCKLILPLLDKILVPKCVPFEDYLQLGATKDKLIQYNGIDEIAWLWNYSPDSTILNKFHLKPKKYIILRTEPSTASYFLNSIPPEKSLITTFFPKIFQNYPNFKYLIIARSMQQENYLKKELKPFLENVIITRFLPNMVDLCYHAALVISGGGTIVREASLLNTPCIEFFQGYTAPQEEFLMENGFPIEHVKDSNLIVSRALEILSKSANSHQFQESFREKIKRFENPNLICFKILKKELIKT